eukprot:TRINITY_DN7579_c0_g1_i1.p1 TRINITY_DN7579_c0_g1~~TRINITY_DN7579_c0_g1_i1.p1  ORF type:complete len:546 (-),score=91.87 TRINITY_DN7579_c0_g1_i1:125-1534(-)
MKDEEDYTTVDYSKAQALRQRAFRPFNFRGNRGRGQPLWRGGRVVRGRVEQRQSKWKQSLRNDNYRTRRTFVQRVASVDVRPTWKVVAQFALSDLGKLDAQPPANPQDLKTCGFFEQFSPEFNTVSVRTPVPLRDCSNKTFHSVTTTEDPIIRDMSMEDAPADIIRVFCTDTILAAIMASTRSANSWDLQVEVMDLPAPNGNGTLKVIFFDKRTDDFDMLPVGESSRDPSTVPPQNRPLELSEELGLVNQRFSQTVLRKGGRPIRPHGAEPNPFAEKGDDVASALYKYRRWVLGKRFHLYVRTQLDGVAKGKDKDQTYRIFALNEYDPKMTDWRRKLETMPGAVLATEIKNNASTLAKWTSMALLAGADHIKLGYIARSNPQNRMDHQILQIQQYAPLDFARQIALNVRNIWGIAQAVIEECGKLREGKYILLKDPNKQMLHLYSIPDDEVDDADEGAEGEGDGEEVEL